MYCNVQAYIPCQCSYLNDVLCDTAGTWAKRMWHLFLWAFDWAWPHIKQMVSLPTVTALFTVVVHTLPSALRSRAALHKAVKCGL